MCRDAFYHTQTHTPKHIQHKLERAKKKNPKEEISRLEFNACIIHRDHGVGGLFTLKYAKNVKTVRYSDLWKCDMCVRQ